MTDQFDIAAQLVANKKIEKTPEIVWYDACMEGLDATVTTKKSNQTWEFSYNAEGLVPDVFTAI